MRQRKKQSRKTRAVFGNTRLVRLECGKGAGEGRGVAGRVVCARLRTI